MVLGLVWYEKTFAGRAMSVGDEEVNLRQMTLGSKNVSMKVAAQIQG